MFILALDKMNRDTFFPFKFRNFSSILEFLKGFSLILLANPGCSKTQGVLTFLASKSEGEEEGPSNNKIRVRNLKKVEEKLEFLG